MTHHMTLRGTIYGNYNIAIVMRYTLCSGEVVATGWQPRWSPSSYRVQKHQKERGKKLAIKQTGKLIKLKHTHAYQRHTSTLDEFVAFACITSALITPSLSGPGCVRFHSRGITKDFAKILLPAAGCFLRSKYVTKFMRAV